MSSRPASAAAVADRVESVRAGPAAFDWRAILLQVAAVWVVTRLLVFVAAAVVAWRAGHGVLGSWAQWDTNWYLLISRTAYNSARSANFFPLFPTLIGIGTWAIGDGLGPVYPAPDPVRLAVALVISNSAAFFALLGVGMLARAESGDAAAARVLRLAGAYPMAFFLAAAYTEGLFIAFSAFALLFARRRAWYLASAAAFLAGLTRSTAVVLIPALVYELGRQHGWWRRAASSGSIRAVLPQAVAAVGGVPAAFATYAAYLYFRFGDPLLFLHTQERFWHHRFMPPWQTVALVVQHLARPAAGMIIVDVLAVLGFGAVLALGAKRLPLLLVIYSVGVTYVCLAAPVPTQSDVIASSARYLLAAFPVFFILAQWIGRRWWLEAGVIAVSALLQLALLRIFVTGGPVL
jgi:hypothetical protein